ncbi:hypothetical protein GLAREA_04258 [Glarea lozoyensis ATCC 20868]|uniref:Uncharacterized protein n=1 Tax=Glarea lozoyensis (strain ATCC 20868 / MF5171) TaxID=1116229 RepID=S3CLU1_GLAL2|nr:uncharacterized protein GLAREA_04258 [Glarea lozoyensis ATCC 20868]EPE27467.1 hypothetical protein GLAREA_04258 [Glarea lozoyensis ATCC 20868]
MSGGVPADTPPKWLHKPSVQAVSVVLLSITMLRFYLVQPCFGARPSNEQRPSILKNQVTSFTFLSWFVGKQMFSR